MDDQPPGGASAPPDPESDEPIHEHFGLSYANYLMLHRTLLQSMPLSWQRKFVALLGELAEAYAHLDDPVAFRVQPVDAGGRYARDPVPHYDRGRAFVPPRGPAACGHGGVTQTMVFGATGQGRTERPAGRRWPDLGGMPPRSE
jgi:hypothetical protein